MTFRRAPKLHLLFASLAIRCDDVCKQRLQALAARPEGLRQQGGGTRFSRLTVSYHTTNSLLLFCIAIISLYFWTQALLQVRIIIVIIIAIIIIIDNVCRPVLFPGPQVHLGPGFPAFRE